MGGLIALAGVWLRPMETEISTDQWPHVAWEDHDTFFKMQSKCNFTLGSTWGASMDIGKKKSQ